jgi:hypothetical protein
VQPPRLVVPAAADQVAGGHTGCDGSQPRPRTALHGPRTLSAGRRPSSRCHHRGGGTRQSPPSPPVPAQAPTGAGVRWDGRGAPPRAGAASSPAPRPTTPARHARRRRAGPPTRRPPSHPASSPGCSWRPPRHALGLHGAVARPARPGRRHAAVRRHHQHRAGSVHHAVQRDRPDQHPAQHAGPGTPDNQHRRPPSRGDPDHPSRTTSTATCARSQGRNGASARRRPPRAPAGVQQDGQFGRRAGHGRRRGSGQVRRRSRDRGTLGPPRRCRWSWSRFVASERSVTRRGTGAWSLTAAGPTTAGELQLAARATAAVARHAWRAGRPSSRPSCSPSRRGP